MMPSPCNAWSNAVFVSVSQMKEDATMMKNKSRLPKAERLNVFLTDVRAPHVVTNWRNQALTWGLYADSPYTQPVCYVIPISHRSTCVACQSARSFEKNVTVEWVSLPSRSVTKAWRRDVVVSNGKEKLRLTFSYSTVFCACANS